MASAAGQDDPSGEQNNKQVHIHVKEDSNHELERLFDVSLNREQKPLQIPLRMRNLPASFWQPPTIGSKSPSVHSRENSLDNSLGGAPFSPGPGASPGPPNIGSHHSRANSCPATLGQTLAVAQQHQNHALQNQNHHLRQHSYDVGGGDDLGPLPPGWEKAQTPQGQIYFMNHITKTTQWEDPRKAINNQKLRQLNGTASPRSAVSPLPQNAQGELQLGPLPHGWEQSVTEQGEVYFIHHQTKKTTWFDPRIPIASQQPLKHVQGQGNDALDHERRLMELKMKRQELQKSQHMNEYKRNQLMRQAQRARSASQENVAMNQTQEMMMRHSLNDGTPGHTNIDPFLGQGNTGEAHNRQESADSGLGMGSNFNLGSIPEDMGMENMDTADLDTTLTENSIQGQQQQQQGMETEELIPTLPELGDELTNDIMTILNPNKVESDSLTWL